MYVHTGAHNCAQADPSLLNQMHGQQTLRRRMAARKTSKSARALFDFGAFCNKTVNAQKHFRYINHKFLKVENFLFRPGEL